MVWFGFGFGFNFVTWQRCVWVAIRQAQQEWRSSRAALPTTGFRSSPVYLASVRGRCADGQIDRRTDRLMEVELDRQIFWIKANYVNTCWSIGDGNNSSSRRNSKRTTDSSSCDNWLPQKRDVASLSISVSVALFSLSIKVLNWKRLLLSDKCTFSQAVMRSRQLFQHKHGESQMESQNRQGTLSTHCVPGLPGRYCVIAPGRGWPPFPSANFYSNSNVVDPSQTRSRVCRFCKVLSPCALLQLFCH